jgi:TrmH family RNA methyltransferase
MNYIESPKNPKIKFIKKLLSSKKERDDKGQFILEGPKAIESYAQAGGKIVELFYSKEAKDLPKVKAQMTECNHTCMEAISDVAADQGVVAIAQKRDWTAQQVLKYGRVVLLEQVQDPGNLGTAMRTAAAFGYGVILTEGCADVYNPKVVRALAGNLLTPFIYVSTSEALRLCEGRFVVTTYKTTETPSFNWQLPLVIVLGNEGQGLSPIWKNIAKANTWIPSKVESLNVAVTSAILMWEGTKIGPSANR